MNLLRAYGRLLQEKPISTKCITSFVTFGAGDLMCQYFEINYAGKSKYDLNRAFKQATFGFLVSPYLHLHFSIVMPTLFPATKKYSVVKSLLYDQTIGASVFISLFFGYLDFMSGKSYQQFCDEMKVKFMPTLVANWSVWPAIMLINFTFVPVQWRVLYANIAGMFWNAYLSYVQNVKAKTLVAQH